MTTARIQPLCKKHNINICCSDASRTNPRNITERYIALYKRKNQFCLGWKSENSSFNKAIEEVETTFKIFDNDLSAKIVRSFAKYELNPRKVQSQLTNNFVYDLET